MSRHARVRRWLTVGVMTASTVVLGACGDDSAGPDTAASVEELAENNDPFGIDAAQVGETVTVSAQVAEVLGPKAFSLLGQSAGENLLVLSRKPAKVREGEFVEVTGKVRSFSHDAYGAKFNLGEADPYTPFDQEQIVVASKVQDVDQDPTTVDGPPTGSG